MQLRRYERQTPELLGAAQLFNVTHLLDYWYGVTWERVAPLHGALERASGGELPVRGPVVLRADRLSPYVTRLDPLLRRGWRNP